MMIAASRANTPVVVACGRTGDVCAAIPIAHELSYQTGNPTPFIVSREYAPLLEACSYVEPIIVDQPFYRLNRVLRQFQTRYKQMHVAQIYSEDQQFPEPTTDSFITDAWERAGMLHKFGLPLVLDRRESERERKLLSDHGLGEGCLPYIVVHGGGVSSPYPYRHELLKALYGVSGRIIDITAFSCSKPQDLIAVLEGAACAILADSFPLHLSFACPNLPVIALQTDRPYNWFGAPPRANWIAKFRYEESRDKMADIVSIAESAIANAKPIGFQFPTGAYNASMLDYNGKRLYSWRYHHEGNWKTRLKGYSKREHPIVLPPEYDAYSQEDARLFLHHGRPHISLTISKCEGPKPSMRDAKCAVIYGELQMGQLAWKVKNIQQVKYGRNDLSAMEKNWAFWSQDGRLYCLYASEPEQIVLEILGDKVVAEHRSPSVPWAHGGMRGDSITLHDGKLVRLFHTLTWYPSGKFRYFIGRSLLESKPPFRTIEVTAEPLFAGDECRPKTLFHSKPNVALAFGAVKEGNELVIALSRNDDSTTLQRINL